MTTFAVLKARIADDLASSDYTTQINTAVLNAIKRHERTRFYFNTSITDTFATVADQEYYGTAANAKIPNLITIDRLYSTISSVRYPLRAVQADDIAAGQSGSSTGDPRVFAYEAQQIRLDPIPSAVRTITATWHYRLTALSADDSTNAWVTDAEELTRASAECDLYMTVLRDRDQAAVMKAREDMMRRDLLRETRMRRSVNHLRTDYPAGEAFDIRTG